jgi:TPR repeat protein
MSDAASHSIGASIAMLLCCATPASAQPVDKATLEKSAKSGDAAAQNELGFLLQTSGKDKDRRQARLWFKRAMDGGDTEAKNNYATMLALGIGGPTDAPEAKRLREEAAAEGSEGANLTIAEYYLAGGNGYPRDPNKAFAAVVAAAESSSSSYNRHCYAQWRAGMMVLQGIGTAKDSATAYRWVKRSADNGCVNGMISAAVMLATGDGVAEDDVTAREFYSKASESGDQQFAHALRGLAGMLLDGEGGPVDTARGIAYLLIAKAAGDENAGTLLDRYEPKLTADLRAQAISISNQWAAEHLK